LGRRLEEDEGPREGLEGEEDEGLEEEVVEEGGQERIGERRWLAQVYIFRWDGQPPLHSSRWLA